MKDLEVDWSAITDIFITHSHRDHFDNTIKTADAIYKIKEDYNSSYRRILGN